MKEPLLLAQIDKYKLDIHDFDDRFTRIIYSSIYNMFVDGARTIGVIDIDNYLSSYPDLKATFNDNNGIQYLQDCDDISDLVNFNYYYQRVKKFSALRALKQEGFDISLFYCENVLDKNYSSISERFDTLSVKDIFDEIKKKLLGLEEHYMTASSTSGSSKASEQLRELKEQFKIAPEIGRPLQGEIYNAVARGARKGKFYVRSAQSGSGKSRLAVGDACNLSIPTFYDNNKKTWIIRNYFERSLIITTELDKDEIQTLILAWVSGVNEEVILTGRYTMEEEARVNKAIDIIEKYSDNLILEQIADPNIAQIESVIRKQVLINGVENIFYDYIFSSPSLLNEYAQLKIREDVCLLMLATALKDLATELNVFVSSSTQITGDLEAKRGIRDQRFIQSSKSIINKADLGSISMWIPQDEASIMKSVCAELNCPIPNFVTDVYKARRSKYKNVKIWSIVDLGTCRIEDICITDGYYRPITDFEVYTYDYYDKLEEPEAGLEKLQEEEEPKEKKGLTLDDF